MESSRGQIQLCNFNRQQSLFQPFSPRLPVFPLCSATVISAWQVIWAVLLWFAINFPRGWLFNIQYLLFCSSNCGWNIWGSIWPVSPDHKTVSRCFKHRRYKKLVVSLVLSMYCIRLSWFVALVYMIRFNSRPGFHVQTFGRVHQSYLFKVSGTDPVSSLSQ